MFKIIWETMLRFNVFYIQPPMRYDDISSSLSCFPLTADQLKSKVEGRNQPP